MCDAVPTPGARISQREDESMKSLLPYGNRSGMGEKSRAHNSAGRSSRRNRPQQDSQMAFSAAARCTSVRQCLIRALIKSQKREGVTSPWRVRDSDRMKTKQPKGMHWENRKEREKEREREESFVHTSRRSRINYLRGGTTIDHGQISIWIAVIALMELDSSTRMRERAFGPRTEKLKSQHELRDRISSEFSIGVPAAM